MTTSTLSISLALLGGVLNVLSPCVLPILPVLLGRCLTTSPSDSQSLMGETPKTALAHRFASTLQSHTYRPVALVGGLITGFALAGSLLGITASWFTGLANLLRNGAIALLFFLGLLAIFPTWNYRIFTYIPVGKWAKKPARIGLMGEFLLGTQLGLLWTPCAGPVLGGILVLAAVNHQVVGAFWLLLAYGIGAGLPLLAIAYGGRVLSQRILNLRSHSAALQRIGGVAIAATAIGILLGWDVQVQLWLAPFFPTQPL